MESLIQDLEEAGDLLRYVREVVPQASLSAGVSDFFNNKLAELSGLLSRGLDEARHWAAVLAIDGVAVED